GGLALMPPVRADKAAWLAVLHLLKACTGDAVIARGFDRFSGLIAESCAQVAALAKDLAPALKRLRTRSVLVWDSGGPKTIAFAHAGCRAGASVCVASHATASVFDGPVARGYGEIRAEVSTAGAAVDTIIVQSPTVASAARAVAPGSRLIKVLPFLWG